MGVVGQPPKVSPGLLGSIALKLSPPQNVEWQIYIKMFLDEYLLWEAGGLHCPVILQGMFLQAAYLGQKEVEQIIH